MPIFVLESDFSDVIKYVLNEQVISPIPIREVDSVTELCKMSDLSSYDIQIFAHFVHISVIFWSIIFRDEIVN